MFNPWGQEDPLEKEMTTRSIILVNKSRGQRRLAGYSPWGHKQSDTTEHKCEVWAKKFIWVFDMMFWKNPNELFGPYFKSGAQHGTEGFGKISSDTLSPFCQSLCSLGDLGPLKTAVLPQVKCVQPH